MKVTLFLIVIILLIWFSMDDKISLARAIINDPHYWVPVLIFLLAALYMLGRFVYLEKKSKDRVEQVQTTTNVDSVNHEQKKEKQMSKSENDEPKKDKSGDTYSVTSHNQSGGVTAGKIENLVVSEEDASGINPYENATIEQTGLAFKIRPKIGKWISPFVMIPLAEKDSVSIEFSNASTTGTMFDVSNGVVDTNSDGSQWYGHVCGLNGGVPNPATKDFYYTVTFSSLPSRFIFGDRSSKNKVAFMWVRGQ